MRSYFCSSCGISWWPIHVIDSGCPVCRGGLKPSIHSPTPDAAERFKAAREAKDEEVTARTAQEKMEAYFTAWDKRKWRETEDFLRGLPEVA